MKLFHDLLEVHGYSTLQTKDGREALDLAREHRPNLILMDIQLPEVSGLEVTKWIKAAGGDYHLLLVDERVDGDDVLRFCSQVRSNETTRQAPVLIMLDDGDTERLAKELDLGVNDYLVRPVNKDELTARARTQIRRKQFEDNLRRQYEKSLTEAVTDSLTGLYNRRYLETHFEELTRELSSGGRPISLLIMDADHFKQVNDDHGHAAGDDVLRGIAQRVMGGVRSFDTPIRLGGEEFVVLMPNVDAKAAFGAANRLAR